MFRRILLAYDGSKEGRSALREGALLARTCGAKAFLLCVVPTTASVQFAEATHAGPVARMESAYRDLFDEAIDRLEKLGLTTNGRCVTGEPAQEIAHYAQQIGADLVVVGHRRQTLLERWWSGQSGAYLVDNLRCSVLVARKEISDADFQAATVN